VTDAFGGSVLENKALVLATAIEGLVNEYFSDRRDPDANYLKELAAAMPVVEELQISDSAKGTLVKAIEHAHRKSASAALYRLAEEGVFPKRFAESWSKLRPKIAHAGRVSVSGDGAQRFVDLLHTSLELFYRLILQHARYVGPIVQYSEANFPSADFVAVKSRVSCDIQK
jgi:hypothetical protein